MHQLEFENAPKENLATWKRVQKLITVASIGIAATLLIMFFTLV